jgi:transcriptional regulator with XRE-family HTH domain
MARNYESSALRPTHGGRNVGHMAKSNRPAEGYEEFLVEFGDIVKRRREALEMSQDSVAGNYSQANVSRLEKGKQGFDSEFLFYLSRSLQVDLATLFAFTKPREGGLHYEILAPEEYALIQNFRRLQPGAQRDAQDYVEFKAVNAAPQKGSAELIPLPSRRSKPRK